MKKENPVTFDSSDPRSSDYIRILYRPPIDWKSTTIRCIAPIAVAIICFFSLSVIGMRDSAVLLIVFTGLVFYFFLSLKKIIITLVSIYQAVAPEKIRRKCRYEPSCSQYMIIAVEKYGAFKGLLKGIKRLSRCNSRGDGLRGGIDYP